MAVVVGVVLGVSRLASAGGPMGDGGLAAWRLSCCGPSWSSVCPLVGAGCGGSSVASLAAAAVVSVCVGGGGLGRRVCSLPRLVAVLGLYGGGGFSAFIL